MPHYYFDLKDGENDPDREGYELASDEAARTEAVVLAGQHTKESRHLAAPEHEFHIRVLNDAHNPLFQVTVTSTALEPGAKPAHPG